VGNFQTQQANQQIEKEIQPTIPQPTQPIAPGGNRFEQNGINDIFDSYKDKLDDYDNTIQGRRQFGQDVLFDSIDSFLDKNQSDAIKKSFENLQTNVSGGQIITKTDSLFDGLNDVTFGDGISLIELMKAEARQMESIDMFDATFSSWQALGPMLEIIDPTENSDLVKNAINNHNKVLEGIEKISEMPTVATNTIGEIFTDSFKQTLVTPIMVGVVVVEQLASNMVDNLKIMDTVDQINTWNNINTGLTLGTELIPQLVDSIKNPNIENTIMLASTVLKMESDAFSGTASGLQDAINIRNSLQRINDLKKIASVAETMGDFSERTKEVIENAISMENAKLAMHATKMISVIVDASTLGKSEKISEHIRSVADALEIIADGTIGVEHAAYLRNRQEALDARNSQLTDLMYSAKTFQQDLILDLGNRVANN